MGGRVNSRAGCLVLDLDAELLEQVPWQDGADGEDIVDGINGKFKLRRVMQSLHAGDSGNSMAMPSSLHVSPCNRVGRATEHLCM